MIMGHCSCCAHTHECAPEKHIEKKESIFAEYWKVGLSFILLITGIIMNALELPFFREGYFSLIWYVVAYLPVGLPVMKEAWESMKDKDYFSEFTLMFVATLGAFYIGEYPEGVAVMLFYSVGELFQEKAVDKAKRNIGHAECLPPCGVSARFAALLWRMSPARGRVAKTRTRARHPRCGRETGINVRLPVYGVVT